MNNTNAGIFFLTWMLIFFSLALLNRWEGTRVLVYYILVLAIVLDIVTHYQDIVNFAELTGLYNPPTKQDLNQFTGTGTKG